ncbi:hypothetical protein [uncultured Treponema sp.]|uniref:hypothetical protein n=1 Tax=uncultured Treponema sp. TaxID=162155 RepID=UPI0025FA5A9B|nr:hypothetical protein [uncultured Treponema sp.]
MKAETMERKLKEMKEARKKMNPRYVNKIAEAKQQEKELKAKIKAKQEQEQNKHSKKTVKTKTQTHTQTRNSDGMSEQEYIERLTGKEHPSVPKNKQTKAIRNGLINYNPYYEEQFNSMPKAQLKKEVEGLVEQLVEDNKTCVQEGLKSFENEQELILASVKEAAQTLRVSSDNIISFIKGK